MQAQVCQYNRMSQNGGVPTQGENTTSDKTNARVNVTLCADGFIFFVVAGHESRVTAEGQMVVNLTAI